MQAPVPSPASDPEPAEWVVAGVRDFDYTVGSIVPAVFEAYVRVLHPAGGAGGAVRWSEVAADHGRTMHPAVEWGSLVWHWPPREAAEVWEDEPQTGNLQPSVAAPLASVLATHTTTPERCWFGVWEGYGESHPMLMRKGSANDAGYQDRRQALLDELAAEGRLLRSSARFTLPQRPMWLLEGSVQSAASDLIPGARGQSANIWWPDDRAWCVGSEIDLMSTYVGGSRACIEEILACEELEGLSVSDAQRVTWDADEINPLPPETC